MNTIFASMMTYWELDLTADDAEKQHEMQSIIEFLFCCGSERSEDKNNMSWTTLYYLRKEVLLSSHGEGSERKERGIERVLVKEFEMECKKSFAKLCDAEGVKE